MAKTQIVAVEDECQSPANYLAADVVVVPP